MSELLTRLRATRPTDQATTHLLLLRAFIAFGWLRAFVDKIGNPDWWDGTAVTHFLRGGAATTPIHGFAAIADRFLVPAAAQVGWAVIILELAIGLAVLTGFRFDIALAAGIGLAAVFIMAGQINPATFYIIIQVALIGSPAGDAYSIDPVGRTPVHRWGLPLGIGAVAMAIWGTAAAGPLSPSSVGDPAAVLAFLSLFALAAIWFAWQAATATAVTLPRERVRTRTAH